VFAGQKPGRPLSVMALEMVLRRMNIDGVTVHGFRSAFRDWAAECTNFPNEVCEAALAHVIENKAEAAYRRGDLFEKRGKLMESWARYCTTPSQAKIVEFPPIGERDPADGSTANHEIGVLNYPQARGRSANRCRTRYHRRPARPALTTSLAVEAVVRGIHPRLGAACGCAQDNSIRSRG
jgi:hypothetical protein